MGPKYRGFVENIIVPVYDAVRGTHRKKYRKILEKTQWLSIKEIEEIQAKNLKAILQHAYDTVPFYREAFKERSLEPSDIQTVEDMNKLPTLTKAHIQNYKEKLITKNFTKDQLIPYHTGGTGNFTRYFITKEHISWRALRNSSALQVEGSSCDHTIKLIRYDFNTLKN